MANLRDSNLTDYIADHPCVTCLNPMELDALLIVLLATKAGYTMPTDLNTLVDATVCLRCYTDTQLKQSLAAFLWEQNASQTTNAELLDQAKCLQCVDPQTMKVLYGYLLVLGLTPLDPT